MKKLIALLGFLAVALWTTAQLTTFPVTGGGSGATTVAGLSDAGSAAYSNSAAFALRAAPLVPNANGTNWIMIGQTNGTATIQVRADGSRYIGPNAWLNEGGFGSVAQLDFDKLYFPAITSITESNGPTKLHLHSILLDNADYNRESEFFVKQEMGGGAPTTHFSLYSHKSGGTVASQLDMFADADFANSILKFTKNFNQVFAIDSSGDITEIKDLAYSWPTNRGGARAILSDIDNSGSLAWSQNGGGLTNLNISVSFLSTNALSTWPPAPQSRGGAAMVNSNGTVYILTSAPASLTWAATNKIAP